MFELPANFGREFAIPFFGADVSLLAQKAVHALARGNRVARKFVAKIIERKLQAVGEANGVLDRFGHVAENATHFLRAAQVTVAVDLQQFASPIEVRVIADAGEDIEDDATCGFCVEDAIGGEQGEAIGFSEIAQGLDFPCLLADLMALDFDEEVVAVEDVEKTLRKKIVAC